MQKKEPPQKGKTLEFHCQRCEHPLPFSLFEMDEGAEITCSQCNQNYFFNDETLIRQLKKFHALCLQIRDSQEILGNTSVGIDIGSEQVKIPFKLLLTRLRSCLDLTLEGKPLTISFRFEPINDL